MALRNILILRSVQSTHHEGRTTELQAWIDQLFQPGLRFAAPPECAAVRSGPLTGGDASVMRPRQPDNLPGDYLVSRKITTRRLGPFGVSSGVGTARSIWPCHSVEIFLLATPPSANARATASARRSDSISL